MPPSSFAPTPPGFVFVVPSLRLSGGTLEIARLARDLAARGHAVEIVAQWSTAAPIDTGGVPVSSLDARDFGRWRAIVRAPAMLLALRRRLGRRAVSPRVVFSHYSTFVLASAMPRRDRWFLVQDTEWRFARAGLWRAAVKRSVLAHLRRGRVVTTGAYLSQAMSAEGVGVAAHLAIWADPGFAGLRDDVRDIDLVLVLRPGAHKRLDLAHAVIARAQERYPAWRIAAITPDANLAAPVAAALATMLVRPGPMAMRALHARSRVHLLVSDHEGFGLPPLEAMGAGCVPLCRDAGGVRAYMTGALAGNVVPLAAGADVLIDRVAALLNDPAHWQALSTHAAHVFDAGQGAQPHRLDAPAARAFVTG